MEQIKKKQVVNISFDPVHVRITKIGCLPELETVEQFIQLAKILCKPKSNKSYVFNHSEAQNHRCISQNFNL